jgi:c-di-GMP-binding flagellar brake protein YcgR
MTTKNQFKQRINIDVGANLMLEIDGIDGKLKSHMIGMIPSEFIIIKAPIGHAGVREKLFEGNKVTVRYIQHSHVYGFESYIISLITKPKTMIILDYPTSVVTVSLRKSERYDCYIPCTTEIDGKEYSGTLMDISEKGCRCLISGLPEQFQRKVEAGDLTGVLKFESPSDKEDIEIPVVFVNQSDYKSAKKTGLSFEVLDKETELRVIKLTQFLDKA